MVSLLACGVTAERASAQIQDPGFDSQGSSVADFCYLGANCPGGSWSGTNAGFIHDGSGFGAPGAVSPSWSAFVQASGYIAQQFTVPTSGRYRLAWFTAGRPAGPGFGGDQSYQLRIDGFVIATGSTSSGQGWKRASSGAVNLNAGHTYTLIFQGLTNTDNTMFVDNVYLALDGEATSYGYDGQGRLRTITRSGVVTGGQSTIITHDAAGNRTNVAAVVP